MRGMRGTKGELNGESLKGESAGRDRMVATGKIIRQGKKGERGIEGKGLKGRKFKGKGVRKIRKWHKEGKRIE